GAREEGSEVGSRQDTRCQEVTCKEGSQVSGRQETRYEEGTRKARFALAIVERTDGFLVNR
ncbi:MAG: hypothetical protein ABI808_11900, partial [Pseudonocardiales bacterium]